MDWAGLLKWTIKQTDGTKPTEVPELSQEQRDWLEEVFKSLAKDDVKEMKKLLSELEKNFEDPEKTEEVLNMLEDLRDLLDVLDAPINFCKIGGMFQIFEAAVNEKVPVSVRKACLAMLSSCAQNNPFVQNFFSKIDFMRIAPFAESADESLRLRSISALAAILIGNFLETKRISLANSGLDLLVKLIENELSEPILAKLFGILHDLLEYASFLPCEINTVDGKTDEKSLKTKEEYAHIGQILPSRERDIQAVILKHSGKLSSTLPEMKKHPYRISVLMSLKFYSLWGKKLGTGFEKSVGELVKGQLAGFRKALASAESDDALEHEEKLATEIVVLI